MGKYSYGDAQCPGGMEVIGVIQASFCSGSRGTFGWAFVLAPRSIQFSDVPATPGNFPVFLSFYFSNPSKLMLVNKKNLRGQLLLLTSHQPLRKEGSQCGAVVGPLSKTGGCSPGGPCGESPWRSHFHGACVVLWLWNDWYLWWFFSSECPDGFLPPWLWVSLIP